MQVRRKKHHARADPDLVGDPSEMTESDQVVALVVEAKRTHYILRQIHNLVVFLWLVLGLFHYHSSFEHRWQGRKFGLVDAAGLFQNLWGVVFLALVAVRNDFPINILGINLASCYFGVFVAVHMIPGSPDIE